MRRVWLLVAAVFGVLVVAAPPAAARAPSPSPSVPAAPREAGAGQVVCTVTDKSLIEVSGLVAVDNGYLAVNDSNPEPSAKRIYRLDNQCRVVGSIQYPSNAIDPEDLALAPDGTVWVADIGDNQADRRNVALWKLAPGAKTPVIHRLTYPDGARDAEALLIAGDGTPVIVTKEIGRPAGIYMPSSALVPNSQAGVQLKRVGEIKLPASETPNALGPPGRLVVTGAGQSPDGKRVALRTYADAFEWDVPDGDVVKAITTGKPRATPLPNEPQGESIAYSRDGKTFLTISDLPSEKPAQLLRYTPAVAPAPPVKRSAAAVDTSRSSGGLFRDLSLNDITYLVAGVGLLGVLLVLIGIVGIRRSRNKRRLALLAARGASGSARVSPVDAGNDGHSGPPGGAGRAAAASTPVARPVDDDHDAYRPPKPGQDDDDYGFVDAAPPGRRNSPPPEPPTSGGGVYRASSGARGGAVYGARREPPPERDEPEPYDDDPRRYGRR
jgi:hypothetical protein